MARLEVNIDGDAKGISDAFNQAQNIVGSATDKITKGLKVSRAEIEAWDAAARRNTMETFDSNIKRVQTRVDGTTGSFIKFNRELKLLDNAKFSFGVGASTQLLPKLENDLNNVSKSFRGTNNVAVEFSRIIQDAPYGIQGVANNIQQLGQSLAYEAKNAGSFGAALKTSLASLVSPMSLMVIGISAVTVAWQLYSKWNKKTEKENDATTVTFRSLSDAINGVRNSLMPTEEQQKKFIASLSSVDRAMLEGQMSAQKEITSLKTLYTATQDTSISIENRLLAVKKLKKEFPTYFKSISDEKILAGEASAQYDKLTTSLIAVAKARAASDIISKNQATILANERELADIEKKRNEDRLKSQTDIATIQQGGGTGSTAIILKQQKAEEDYLVRKNWLENQNKDLLKDSEGLVSKVTEAIKEGSLATEDLTAKTEKLIGMQGSLERLNAIKSDLENKISMSVDEVQVTSLYKQLQDVNLEIFKLTNKQHEIKIKVALDKFGTPASDIQAELNTVLTGKVDFGTVRGDEAKEAEKTVAERYDKERKTAEKWLEEKQKLDIKRITEENKVETEFSRTMSSAINRAGRSFYSTLTNLSSLSDATFGGIFASITEGLNSSMNEIFLGTMTDLLKKGIADGTGNLGGALGSQLNVALAGVGLLGGIISGLGSKDKPNYGAKIGGGALQGAAAGAMMGSVIPGIGTVVGGVVGGVLGALGGLFGGKKREKELKLQEDQLAEQQKQTKLMERQNALAYASQVIGRYVEGAGVISNIDIDATGNLVAKVEGDDIYFIYNRVAKKKKMGV